VKDRRNGIQHRRRDTLRQITVGPLLQHPAARAHTGFVRGLTSDNVCAEYLFCAFAPVRKRVGGSLGARRCDTQIPGEI
jgi:hypothetical protein